MKKLGDELVARSRKEANDDAAAMRELLDAERAVMVKKLSAKFKADQMKWFADQGMKHTWTGMLKDNPPKPHTPGTKRRSGAGRKSKLTTEETSRGIIILRGLGRMSTDAAYQTLREAGINAPDSTLYRLIVRPAYGKKS